MNRLHAVLTLAILGGAVASAGTIVPIEVGQINGSNQNLGLTPTYLASGCMGAACLPGGTVGALEVNYDARLFQSAVNGSTMAVPFTNYQQAAQIPPGSTLDQFAMVAQPYSGSGNSMNVWDLDTSTSSITIPIGLNNVNDVQTMMNNIWGLAGVTGETTVTFNYSNAGSNGAIDTSLLVSLVNNGAIGTNTGVIGTSVDCATGSCSTTYATGGLAPSLGIVSTLTSSTFGNGTPTITVTTQNLASDLFNGTTNAYTGAGATSVFNGTTGNVSLDAQDFGLSAYESEYLVNIVVKETNGQSNTSQTAVSAVTVDVLTPEPATVFLFLSGLGALGIARLRRKA